MELTSITIQRNNTWDPHPENFTGKVAYKSKHGEVTVNLDPKLSQEVLKLIADSLVRQSKIFAKDITAETIMQVGGVLEAPK